jgi:colanic acid biosynthesis glycosyl transferase WcaI
MAWPLASTANLAMRHAHDLVTISPHMNAVIAARVAQGGRAPALHTIPLWATAGPDRAALTADAPSDPAVGSNRQDRPLRAMYHGNLGLSYDFEPILAAAARLGDEVAFTLVGEGSRRDELARRIEQDRLRNVQLRAALPAEQFTASLESADVHLLPLRESWDGVSFPSKVLPYLAVGRPIVITGAAHGESAALIREGRCGVVVEGGADGLAAALRSLAHDDAARVTMGAAGRALYVQRFSAARAFAAWDALIAGVR